MMRNGQSGSIGALLMRGALLCGLAVPMVVFSAFASVGAPVSSVSEASADDLPWRRRRRPGVRVSPRARELVNIGDWPAEPISPEREDIDPDRFASALRQLCGWMPPRRPRRWGDWVLQYAGEFGEDPFLVGALIMRMGRCHHDADSMGGLGLTSIPRSMYSRTFTRGVYSFFVKTTRGFLERTRTLDRFPFAGPRLLQAESNIYFAAGLLSTWREQHQTVDEAFEQRPHRHYVSHFVWGDRVLSDRGEDRILTDRRRLLEYYGTHQPPMPIRRFGVVLGSPLHGAPRVVSSWLGAERDGGARRHRGVDVESSLGEPIVAVADGRVSFAGVDFPGGAQHRNMTPDEIAEVPRAAMGNGGRYVCINHRPAEGGYLRSCYMHMEDVEVRWGQHVERGERLGTVGRTGMRSSAAHLHFELHSPEFGVLDSSEVLRGLLLGRHPHTTDHHSHDPNYPAAERWDPSQAPAPSEAPDAEADAQAEAASEPSAESVAETIAAPAS